MIAHKKFLPGFYFLSLILIAACREPVKKPLNEWALLDFQKADSSNPILQPGVATFMDPVTKKMTAWEARNVFNPAIVVLNDTVFMLFRAQDSMGTSRVGLAFSTDGIHFTRSAAPVLYPDNDVYKKYEWPGGCEDPRIVSDSAGTYYMTYTAYDGKNARLLIAVSKDLLHWTKYGPVFKDAYQGKYLDEWSKSGSIVSRYVNGNIVAEKIGGRYWMYWGDQFIWAATSNDLLHWTPVEKQPGEPATQPLKGIGLKMPDLKIVIATRNGYFDSDLVESGPPAMITGSGILLLYNGRNIPAIGDTALPTGTYAGGQALLDLQDPTKQLSRLENNFIKPSQGYELTGEVNNVCFIEGLAQFHEKYFLYYGTADSKIAVAVR